MINKPSNLINLEIYSKSPRAVKEKLVLNTDKTYNFITHYKNRIQLYRYDLLKKDSIKIINLLYYIVKISEFISESIFFLLAGTIVLLFINLFHIVGFLHILFKLIQIAIPIVSIYFINKYLPNNNKFLLIMPLISLFLYIMTLEFLPHPIFIKFLALGLTIPAYLKFTMSHIMKIVIKFHICHDELFFDMAVTNLFDF